MFFEDVKGMTHKSQLNQKASQKLKSIVLQLSQQKTKILVNLSRKDLSRSFCLISKLYDIHGRSKRLLRILYQQRHCQLGSKGKEKFQTLKILQAANRLIKILSSKHVLPFRKRKDNSEDKAQKVEQSY